MNSAKKMMLGMLWAKVGAKGLCPNNARTTPEQRPNNYKAKTTRKGKTYEKTTLPEQCPNNARTTPEQAPNKTKVKPLTNLKVKHVECKSPENNVKLIEIVCRDLVNMISLEFTNDFPLFAKKTGKKTSVNKKMTISWLHGRL